VVERQKEPGTGSVVRVLLADDHAIVREGLKSLINARTDMTVVGEAADGADARALAAQLRPDVVVMDLSMPNVDGAQATSLIRQDVPDVRILALTVHEESSYIASLLQAGASGYVLKRSAPSELVQAIRVVARGETYLDPSVANAVVQGYLGRQSVEVEPLPLSEREMVVLRRISTGFSNKEIAAELRLSVKTVETYKARAMEKLGLATRVDIVRYAARQGWLEGSK
jgi:DNA-binding NarL/FixJ family response regulator